ncbi:MAG: hypothetical protein H6Q70_3177 [Firmicutes bacterium]|nr:hypothetical protein [Bacillota bacterium]
MIMTPEKFIECLAPVAAMRLFSITRISFNSSRPSRVWVGNVFLQSIRSGAGTDSE